MKKIMLVTLLLLISTNAGATEFDETHTGRYCEACHKFGPCGSSCHHDVGEPPSYVRQDHVDPKICSRCHGNTVEKSDIHSIHGEKKEMCDACHSPKGWNSSIVNIAPVETETLVVRPSKNCASCHSISGEKRLHGIHTAFLTEDNCAKCHGERNPTRAEIIRITGRKPGASQNTGVTNIVVSPEVKEVVMAPVNIITDLFNSISNTLMGIFI